MPCELLPRAVQRPRRPVLAFFFLPIIAAVTTVPTISVVAGVASAVNPATVSTLALPGAIDVLPSGLLAVVSDGRVHSQEVSGAPLRA